MAGQGQLYVKVKEGYEFLYDLDNDDANKMMMQQKVLVLQVVLMIAENSQQKKIQGL